MKLLLLLLSIFSTGIGICLLSTNLRHNRMIDGQFTNKTVGSADDAANILNCSSSLFENGLVINASDILVQEDYDETVYKYNHKVNGIPVVGSQIILTVTDNKVTGLFSTYDKKASSTNTFNQVTNEDAVSCALNALFINESEYIDALVIESGLTETEVRGILRDSLTIDSKLIIKSTNIASPELLWQITLKNDHSLEDDEDLGIMIDFDDIYDYGKYILSFVNETYFIYANGNNAGNIMSKTSGNRSWMPSTAEGYDLQDNLQQFNIECEEHGYAYRMFDTVRNIRTYNNRFIAGASNLPGSTVTSYDNTWNDKSSVSIHTNMAKVYDYYNGELQWNSFDGEGTLIKNTIHYRQFETSSSYNNAFWNNSQFVFGDGNTFEAALDIVGHEFTHAVIDYKIYDDVIRGLDYSGETGALNESYADIMGSIIEGKAKTSDERWDIGEDGNETLRSMETPLDHEQPNHYDALSDPEWSNILNKYVDRDSEGVHIFSGVFNHAAYLMMIDDRTSSITDKTWAKVFFKSMNRLTTSSNFLDARGAILSSAKLSGFTQTQQDAIKDAFDQVGISSPSAIRIVLRWGSVPNDLDSHLTGPNSTGNGRFHVYYGSRNFYEDNTYTSTDSLLAADLDYDDTSAFGPEITTIHLLTPGDYYFYVHDYSNKNNNSSTALSSSYAYVRIYQGTSNTVMKYDGDKLASFSVPKSKIGNLWTVCKITVDSSGDVSITPINTLSNHSDPSTVGS